MTDEELKAIEERAAKATPGPWHPAWNRISDEVLDLGSMLIARAPDDATREFIAATRADVPALIAEVRRLREQLKAAAAILRAAGREREAAMLLERVDR